LRAAARWQEKRQGLLASHAGESCPAPATHKTLVQFIPRESMAFGLPDQNPCKEAFTRQDNRSWAANWLEVYLLSNAKKVGGQLVNAPGCGECARASLEFKQVKLKEAATEHKNLRIRKATRADADVLYGLICALADYERLPRPDAEARERLMRDGFGPSPRFDAWLAEIDGKPVGYAVTFFTYSTFLAQPSLYLEDIFVLPEHRAQRVGTALFKHCVRVAYEAGCGRMEWQVLDWNTPAISFYQRMGAARLQGWLPYRLTRAEFERILAD